MGICKSISLTFLLLIYRVKFPAEHNEDKINREETPYIGDQ